MIAEQILGFVKGSNSNVFLELFTIILCLE